MQVGGGRPQPGQRPARQEEHVPADKQDFVAVPLERLMPSFSVGWVCAPCYDAASGESEKKDRSASEEGPEVSVEEESSDEEEGLEREAHLLGRWPLAVPPLAAAD